MAENKDGAVKDGPPKEAAPKVTTAQPATAAAPRKQNPVFRMMGMPNFRFRLPSRNWTIFLSVTGGFAAAVFYDRRQKKAVQKKWCDLVAHIAQETLPVNQTPRKITIFLSAPPGDGIRPSRDYFREYVKPVLTAAAIDYEVIEGRKEGDVRYGTAEQIRRLRRKMGEQGDPEKEPEMDQQQAIELIREKMQIVSEPGIRGDLVLGRHTWKEYIRGLHEGWLGPMDAPPPPPPAEPSIAPVPETTDSNSEKKSDETTTILDSEADKKKEEEEEKKEKEKKPPYPPAAFLPTTSYDSAPISPHIPSILEPSIPIHQLHLLGFLKTPQRIYHFLNRRILADEIGRQTAALVLTAYRPYQQDQSFASTSSSDLASDNSSPALATRTPENDAQPETIQTRHTWEQQAVLTAEEPYWHKSVRKPKPKKEGEEDPAEKIWMADVVIDPRIGERMRLFHLDPEEEARAERIRKGEEKGRARVIDDLRAEKVVVGDVDGE